MAQRAPNLPTFEELYAQIERLPSGTTGEILEPGVLRTMSRPARPHRFTAKRALLGLAGFDLDQGGTGWWIETETEIRFGERLFVPDITGWRVARVPELPNENPLTIVPDWTCEVLSPNSAKDDRLIKLPHYAREGVPWIWIVDPVLHTIEVYETDRGRPALAMTAGESDSVALPPFDGEIELAGWWLPASAPPA
jgi:Uma2 family endonuclease